MANKMQLKPYEPELTEAREKLKSKEVNEQGNQFSITTAPFTIHVSMETVHALRMAATARKHSRGYPATQQEIVQVALNNWLKENGYFS